MTGPNEFSDAAADRYYREFRHDPAEDYGSALADELADEAAESELEYRRELRDEEAR